MILRLPAPPEGNGATSGLPIRQPSTHRASPQILSPARQIRISGCCRTAHDQLRLNLFSRASPRFRLGHLLECLECHSSKRLAVKSNCAKGRVHETRHVDVLASQHGNLSRNTDSHLPQSHNGPDRGHVIHTNERCRSRRCGCKLPNGGPSPFKCLIAFNNLLEAQLVLVQSFEDSFTVSA